MNFYQQRVKERHATFLARYPSLSMVTPKDIERYTAGECRVFARAINRLTNWPIHCFIDKDGEPDGHAFIVCPDGSFLDIEGARTPSEFSLAWREVNHREFSWVDLLDKWGALDKEERWSFIRARKLAKKFVSVIQGNISYKPFRLALASKPLTIQERI